MGRFLFLLSILAVCGLSGGMFVTAWMSSSTKVSPSSHEQAVILPPPVRKCVNMGGALEAPREGEWGYRIRAKDFALLKQSGFDTVRIPIKWSAHTATTAPYYIDSSFLRRVNQVINEASDAGLNVIINVHHYDEISEDADSHLPRLYAIWDQLIALFGSKPQNVMFEFLNEPHSSMSPRRVDEMNRVLLEKVRAVDPTRWVVLGGGDWGTLDGLLKTSPPKDDFTMVTFHYYSPFDFTHQGAPWAHKKIEIGQTWGTGEDRKSLAEDMSRAAKWRDKVGMPLLLGEFGVYIAVPDAERAAWSQAVRRSAENAGFGWCYWDFATSLGMYDQKSETFKPGMLPALIDN